MSNRNTAGQGAGLYFTHGYQNPFFGVLSGRVPPCGAEGRACLSARTERKQRSAGEICLGAGHFHPVGKISRGEAKLRIKLFCLLFSLKKVDALVPGLGRERLKTLRGATQFQNSGAVPFGPRGAAGRPRLSPGPLLALSWPVPVPRGPFSRGALLCPAVFRLLMRRHGGEQSYAIPLLR